MKKKIFLAGIITMAVLAGCGKQAAETENVKLPALAETITDVEVFNMDIDKYLTKLGEYKGLSLTGTQQEVTDETVESIINMYFPDLYEFQSADKDTVEEGDTVNIDYEGLKDGVAFDGGTSADYNLTIGSNQFIEGFEDGLIGHKKGEKVALNLTFPEEYHSEELAGADVVFNVTINDIGKSVITDEKVATLEMENVANEEQLREYIRETMLQTSAQQYQADLSAQAYELIMTASEYAGEIPTDLYEYYRQQFMGSDKQMAESNGMDFEQYITESLGISVEEYNTEVDSAAKEIVNQSLVILKIAELEGLTVEDAAVEAGLLEMAVAQGYESVEDLKKEISVQDYKLYLLKNQVDKLIVDNAKVTEG